MRNHQADVFLENIIWGEGLRWHDNKLWFSDIFGKKVYSATNKGEAKVEADVPSMPSGLGFTPDNRLLIASGNGKLLRLDLNVLTEVADLSKIAIGTNDMVVAPNGNAYIGCYGFDITKYDGGNADGWITLVKPDGSTAVTGIGLSCPNGMVITSDGKTLIAADTIAKALVSFDIDESGILSNKEVWASMDSGPDGIALDQSGNIWAATPHSGEVVCVAKGGKILDVIKCSDTPLCCVLGGKNNKTLFIVTVPAGNELSPEDLQNPQLAQSKAGSKILTINLT